jgi:hypothetical protein
MSTDYLPSKPINFERLKREVKASKILSENMNEETSENKICITDGPNFLWTKKSSSSDSIFSRYGDNEVSAILEEIERIFKVQLISEHDDGFMDILRKQHSSDFVVINFEP